MTGAAKLLSATPQAEVPPGCRRIGHPAPLANADHMTGKGTPPNVDLQVFRRGARRSVAAKGN